MAIIPTTKTTIARYAAGLYGVKLGSQTLNAVVEDVHFNTANGVSGLNAVMNSYYAPFAGMTSAQVAGIVVANAGVIDGSYGLTAANVADAVATVTAQLNAAAPSGTQGAAIANVLAYWSNDFAADPVFGPAARAWNLKIAQANAYANNNNEDVAFGAINTEFVLSGGTDRITGTEGEDTFVAGFGTLNNADVIDGGAGHDTLKAQVSGIVAPTIKNVEHLQFQAQFRTADSGDNNLADEQIVKVDFNTNVTNVTGFDTIENSNSRADLIIEDVRIANSQITKDITVIMRETDPGNVDYGVYFDQNSLRNVSSSSSQINLRVLDTYNTALSNSPLKDSPYGSFKFSYSLNGAEATSVTLASKEIQDAQSFPEMVAALQVAADAIFGAGTVTVSLGAKYSVPDSVTGAQVQGTEIVLAAKGDITFSTPAGSGWLATDVVPATSGLHTSYTVGGATSTELVTVNVVLDDVGRGSTGGDLVIGGLSVGETSTSKGVQKFLIEVQDNSKLQTINSTNNTLKEVVIVNGNTTRVDNAYNENLKNAGSLTVRGFEQPNDGFGNNALPGTPDQHNTFGFSDVRLIDGSAMTGKLDFDAEITQASIAKYLNLKDGAPALPAGDNVAFQYNGGANNDSIAVTIDSMVTASRTLTGREDFTFNVDGGAGNDNLTVNIGGAETGAWYVDQSYLKNITINGGTGNDTIRTIGSGDFRIDAGADNDTVYVNNSGNAGNYVGAQWLVGAANTELQDLQGSVAANAAPQFLYKGSVTVVFSGANTAAAGGVTAGAAALLTNGFEVAVEIPTGTNYAVTQYHVNQAIKAAINDNAVLNKLLVAEDGPGATLVIKSLVAGQFTAADLDILVSGVDVTTLPAAEQSTVLNAYKAFAQNSSALIADAQLAQAATVVAKNAVEGVATSVQGTEAGVVQTGANSVDVTDNTINLGSGDDVLVLSTGANSNETLVYTGYGQGKDSILNFSTAGTSTDLLDFTSYLTGKSSASGSTDSQVRIATSLNADSTVEANSVSVLKLNTTATQNFDGLTIEKLLAAVNSTNVAGVANFAGLQAASLDAVTSYSSTNTLVGGIGKAVVLVENDKNLGQYKAFELTFDGTATNTTKDFTGAQLIGEMDFGNSLGLTATNLTGAVGAWVTGAAGGAGGAPVVPGPVVPGPVVPTAVVVTDLQTYDASTGAFEYRLDFTAAGVKLANINGFGADDTIVLVNPITGSTEILASSSATSLDFVVGDTAAFSNAWAVQLGALDATLVTDVLAVGGATVVGFPAREAVLDAAWGADWFGG